MRPMAQVPPLYGSGVEGSHLQRGGRPIRQPGPLVLLAGDVHGSLRFIEQLASTAVLNGCSTILQLGDFGFWPDMRLAENKILALSERHLDAVAGILARFGVAMRVIDGNHDFCDGVRKNYPSDGSSIVPLRDGLLDWAPRGSLWNWGDQSFVALGGAVSVDQDSRVPLLEWWPNEAIDVDELDLALSHGQADVLVCHDCPAAVDLANIEPLHGETGRKIAQNRAHLYEAVARLRPSLVVHGHYHLRHTSQLRIGSHVARIEGFGCDDDPLLDAVSVLDLSDLSVQAAAI